MEAAPHLGGMGWSRKEVENRIKFLKDKDVVSGKHWTYVITDEANAAMEYLALGHRLGDPDAPLSPLAQGTLKLMEIMHHQDDSILSMPPELQMEFEKNR